MNDSLELLQKIRRGDEDAFKTLLEKHHNMIYKIISNYTLKMGDYRIDTDDLYQEASLALYSAAMRFEEGKGVKFSTFAYRVIRGRIADSLRKQYRTYGQESVSLDKMANSEFNRHLAIKDHALLYHKEEQFREYLNDFVRHLNDEDRSIFHLYLNEHSYREIAEVLNVTTKKIDNRLFSLKKRLRLHLSDV